MKQILVFDNYDSFTHNLLHLLQKVRPNYRYTILRNSNPLVFDIDFDMLVISPGPMTPEETGLLKQLFEKKIVPNKIPVFGVCLGMQFLASICNISVEKSTIPSHGAAVHIEHSGNDLFQNIPNPFTGARYNSLEVKKHLVLRNKHLEVLAFAPENDAVMALKHKSMPWFGVQFHPESFLTEHGDIILDHFFKQYVENPKP